MPTLTGEVKRVTYENEATSFRVIKLLTGDGSPGSSRVVTVVGTFQAVGPWASSKTYHERSGPKNKQPSLF